jgi:hypothetical protein
MRRWMLWLGVMAAALLVVAFGYGCGETTAGTCADNGTCVNEAGAFDGAPDVSVVPEAGGGGDDGGTGSSEAGSSGGEAGPSACNTAGEPKDTPCLIDEMYGVFVSPAGNDGAAGTRAAPLKTLTAGITKALLGAKRVFACVGTYDEHLVVGISQDGVGVYGGFDCAGWMYQASNLVKVAPSTTGYALEVDSLTAGAKFEDLEFDAQSAQMPGDSSIAVFANQSVVTFRRVTMKAGDGAMGVGGDAGSNYTTAKAPRGNDADGGAGGAQQTCTCPNGDQSVGGAGGNGGAQPSFGAFGAPPLDGGVRGPPDTGSCSTGTGGNGAGSSDAPIATGAVTSGGLSPQGWSPGLGATGTTASVAQGGGGGGGSTDTTGHGGGGSGGCGGCGGGGGTAGRGGGSSFALLSYKSTVAIDSGAFAGANGQTGSPGGAGQAGQMGGFSGSGSSPGCSGGPGGTGGGGSGGGGGAGGLSVAIGYVGTAPAETGTVTKTVGNFGTGGAGGAGGGANNSGGKGKDGVATAELAL